MYYLSKKDFIYALAIWNAPIILIVISLFYFSYTLLVVSILSIILAIWIWNSTSYKIENGELYIKCWVLRKQVNIKNITQIKETKNILSSYALSAERLEITENSNSKFYVSPINFDSFIEELKKWNSLIVVNN